MLLYIVEILSYRGGVHQAYSIMHRQNIQQLVSDNLPTIYELINDQYKGKPLLENIIL